MAEEKYFLPIAVETVAAVRENREALILKASRFGADDGTRTRTAVGH